MCTQLFPMQSVRSVSAEAELAASVPAPSASVLASNALVVSRLMSYMWLLLFLRAIPSPDVLRCRLFPAFAGIKCNKNG
jgi:hypothetical protein